VYRTVTDNALGRIPLDDREAWRVYQNYYFNCLRDVDRRIGEVFAALERSGELANTIVVLTSDHGELGGAHGLRAKGNTIYRQTAALPLAILHPDIKDGADTPALASQLDFAPTLLAFAGISAQERADQLPALKGVDLSRAMGPGAARSLQAAGRTATYYQWDSMVYASADAPALAAAASSHTGLDRARYLWRLEHAVRDASTRHHLRGAYDGRYKFARYFRPVDRSRPTDWDSLTQANDLELYDTLTDPFERVNLAYRPEYRDEVLRMSGIVNHLIATEVGSSDAPPSLLLI
jgi:arylsulfatase